MTRPAVVVGSQNARASIGACLEALLAQRTGEPVEIVVVDASTDGTGDLVRRGYPGVRRLALPPSALMPELWEAGIRATVGDVVAITTGHCVPDPEWLPRLLEAHAAPVAGVGGAIEQDAAGGPVSWAVYFCRYSRYMLPFPGGPAAEIAGDNASYKRAEIDRCRTARRHGFWESAVNAELRRTGGQLVVEPSVVVVCHRDSLGLRSFVAQRFRHGTQFGRERARHLSGWMRVLYAAATPGIPLLLLARIARHVVTKRRHRLRFLACTPILMLFLLAWSAGELIGYLQGAGE